MTHVHKVRGTQEIASNVQKLEFSKLRIFVNMAFWGLYRPKLICMYQGKCV